MSDREKILKILTEKHQQTGGHCGTYLADFGIEYNKLKKELNQLHKEGLTTWHDGAHGLLFKLKTTTDDNQL